MKKTAYLLLGLLLILLSGFFIITKFPKTKINQKINNTFVVITPTYSPQRQNNSNSITVTLSRSIFIPYWAGKVSANDLQYDAYYYFGVRPALDGSIEDEPGLQNIQIVAKIPEKKKKLIVRMLDAAVTEGILGDVKAQNTLISEVKKILTKNMFSGIVLDVEVPFTLQPKKKEQITKLVQKICTDIKAHYKSCDMLIYGDFQYRNRPYDLKALSAAADTILLMAYDFHKSAGAPGPNFSFNEKQKYGYDFKTMIVDATALIPKEKIEVVFGMYGYDWTLNEQDTPLKRAEALSVNAIRNRVAQNANRPNNTRYTLHENAALEKYIQYIDSDDQKHIIWYEDEESVEIKTKYLLEEGISRVSFWAHSYF